MGGMQLKIDALAFDWVQGTGPSHFSNVFHAVADISGCYCLRSAVHSDLFISQIRAAKLGRQSFSIAAPVVSLPPHLRSPSISHQ